MIKHTAILALAIAALAFALPVQAHHSGGMYDPTGLWIKGTIVKFEKINPHTILTLEDKDVDGKVRRWIVEGPPENALARIKLDPGVLKIGDVIQSCAFGYRKEFADKAPKTDADGTPRKAVAGHVLILPNGQKQMWEPHGYLSECLRLSQDQPEGWLEFAKSNLSAWCEQRQRPAQWIGETKTYADKVDALLGNPCK